jgi:hypothetical protein
VSESPQDQQDETPEQAPGARPVVEQAKPKAVARKPRVDPNPMITEERVGPAGPLRTLILVVGALATVVVLNWSAERALHRYTTNIGYYLIVSKWELLESQRKPVDWLFLGDSSCNQAVRPDIIAAERGETALNLCTIGDMLAVDDAWMLGRYLREVGKPKHVVIVHVYDMWPRSADRLQQGLMAKIPLGWGFWERMDPPLALAAKHRTDLLLSRYVPLYAENITLGDWAMHPSKMLAKRFRIDQGGYMRNDLARPKEVASDAAGHLRFVRGRKASLSAANRAAMGAIVKLSREHGVPVTMAMAPIVSTLWNEPAFRTFHGQIVDGLRKLGQAAQGRVVLAEPALFSADVMENADHLSHEPAAAYTRKLVAAVLEAEGEGATAPDQTAPPTTAPDGDAGGL